MDDRYTLFTNIIASLNRSIYLIKDEETNKYGLKSMHVSVLYNVYKYKSLTQVELIDICQENKAAISRTLKFLMDENLIEIMDENGKYKKHYCVTEKGKEIGEQIEERINTILDAAAGDISDSNKDKMYKCLFVIDRNLKRMTRANSKK